MKSPHYEALARTTLLLNHELFNGEADEGKIADALLGSTVRLTIDVANLESRAGEAAFVTSCILVARLGIGVEVAVSLLGSACAGAGTGRAQPRVTPRHGTWGPSHGGHSYFFGQSSSRRERVGTKMRSPGAS